MATGLRCPPGWVGEWCQWEDPCRSSPCAGRGVCQSSFVTGTAHFSCRCPRGFQGPDCSLPDPCLSNPCAHGARCSVGPDGRHVCSCPEGYQGRSCRSDVDECRGGGPCHHGATCLNTPGSFLCQCPASYTGPLCESLVVPCAPSPCRNGGTCRQSGEHAYDCACLPGFEGPNCEVNVDDCPGHRCLNGGTCVDGVNTYNCQCPPEWTGQFCTEDVDECQLQPNACHNGGTCFNTLGGHSCVCVNGWTGESCSQNIDDCATAVCFQGATCHDRVASFYCACPMGKTGFSGATCQLDVDECASTPCRNGAKCVDQPDGYDCRCAEGFEGTLCERNIDDCSPDPCHHGRCVDGIASFSCACVPTGPGSLCNVEINECASSPCAEGGSCVDGDNGFRCLCPPGSLPPLCLPLSHPCAHEPCSSHGVCHDAPSGFRCVCEPGWSGPRCGQSLPHDACESQPCRAGGTCTSDGGSFHCTCPPGAQGRQCELRTPCTPNPCENGGRCESAPGQLAVCSCPLGWQGPQCQQDVDECVDPSLCGPHGTCTNLPGTFSCTCHGGYSGPSCDQDIDDCDPNPCLNGGWCQDGVDSFTCSCLPGFAGPLCTRDVDECLSSPCGPGTCTDHVASFTCTCPPGYGGLHCEQDLPDCSPSSCFNGGTCVDGVNSFSCLCRPGYTGAHCQHEADRCLSRPCLNGGVCSPTPSGFHCTCPQAFTGSQCQTLVDWCSRAPCQNGGSCTQTGTSFYCLCPPGWGGRLCDVRSLPCREAAAQIGYTGLRCEADINECRPGTCHSAHTRDCLQDPGGSFRCLCHAGFTGPRCQTVQSPCESQPCQHGGQCRPSPGSGGALTFACHCIPPFWGPRCERVARSCRELQCPVGIPCQQTVRGPRCACPPGLSGPACRSSRVSAPGATNTSCAAGACLHGGSCRPMPFAPFFLCSCAPGWTGPRCEALAVAPEAPEEPRCPLATCRAKRGDRRCDRECNSPGCGWDGGDCSLSVDDPWRQCEALQCWRLFNNSHCDPACSSPACLYDNFDCHTGAQERTCNPVYEKYCADHFADGRCDQGCNTEECGWDGLDCAGEVPALLARGVLVLTVLLPPDELLRSSADFLQRLSAILRTSLRFRLDGNGQAMVFPYHRPGTEPRARRELTPEVIGSVVMLEIDNRLCLQSPENDHCFPDAQSAADYLGALSAVERLDFPYPLRAVRAELLEPPEPSLPLLPLLVAGAVFLLIILVLGVMVARRKREHSTLWFPEGFSLHKDVAAGHKGRREPVGQDALGMKNMAKGESLMGEEATDWMDTDCPEAKRLKVEEPCVGAEDTVDCRQWTQHHLAAADIRVAPAMALTPPQGDVDADGMDVNVRGPDGFTPLMLASFCGGALEPMPAEEDEAEDTSASIISDLICQGAQLGAQTDRTGETALHLAARYARADAAKRLLDAGADTNAQDHSGRTPLHTAVTADAQGVFQSAPTLLHVASSGPGDVSRGLSLPFLLSPLSPGKSALHWAAAVNNVEATLALLKNGANKDMQDSKEETPLFLAAREGSFEAAKLLLDHFANREITDHLDRLPRDVAQERLHQDIVRLLDQPSGPRSPPGPHGLGPLLCPPGAFLPGLKAAPSGGKKSRRPPGKAGLGPQGARGRGRKLTLACPGPLADSSVTLSPVDSLDSPRPFGGPPTSPGGFSLEGPYAAATATAVSLAQLGAAGRVSLGRQPSGGCVLSLGLLNPVAVPLDWARLPPPAQPGPSFLLPLAPGPQLLNPGTPVSPQERPPPYLAAPGHGEEYSGAGPHSSPHKAHFLRVPSEHPYLTPSPESPEHWASPSPPSLSDWSDSTPSPATATGAAVGTLPAQTLPLTVPSPLTQTQTQLGPHPEGPPKRQVLA
ncbi:neurogenic locus notch homolog protein 3 [Echinops telfairi]|uniref:Neurogenic locus notch homolog protein 3 n=1 Tax=Echinops telfairi TaxID=9371 RepID=A0AC55D1L2_ECHTE|nr:neurogenic locus notch homolog protein 3 [Echinops telfairi]